MGQSEVLKFLDENPKKWFSIDDIKQAVNKEHNYFGNVWRQVNKLCANKQVETKLKKLSNCRWGYKRVVKAKQKEEHI